MPKWSGTAALIYKPTERLNILGRATYQGSSWIINEKYKVPSHVLFDLGATYEADVRNTPITFKVMLYNVFGKDYWSAARGTVLSYSVRLVRSCSPPLFICKMCRGGTA